VTSKRKNVADERVFGLEPRTGRRTSSSLPPDPASVPPISGEVGHYESLKGTSGRDVYFRPDRIQRAELGSIGVAVELDASGARHRCELVDVSQNGVAFVWPLDEHPEVGTVFEELTVRFDDHEAYQGEARVSSVRRADNKTIVGASLVDTLMNIEDVLHLRDVKAWAAGGDQQGLGLRQAGWRTKGQERFKALTGELRLMLEDARIKFDELEASLPWHIAHGEHGSPARDALIALVENEFSRDVVQVSAEIDAALRLATGSERDALREYSTRYLHELLMLSPWMHRARTKPLGYPGDFELMNRVYGNYFAGTTLFAKAVDLSFALTPAAVAVRARKDLLKGLLSTAIDEKADPGPVRILSIAAGPAQEIFELLRERETLPRPLEIVLFDQDKRALSFSFGRLQRLVSQKWRDQVSVLHLHDSIQGLLRGPAVFSGHGAFDVVYSCGLFDYLQQRTSVSLCKSLYSLVKPGGTLYVGNMVPENPCRWFMELHLDWFLVYRAHAEILDFAKLAAPDASIEIIEESTKVNPFVALTRG